MATSLLGKIVRFSPPDQPVEGEEQAAIVTRAHSDVLVDLTVFPPDGQAPYQRTQVFFNDGPEAKPNSWRL